MVMSTNYTKYSPNQLHKIGNTIIYLSKKIPNLSKTKLLKLLYILDEISIKKSGIPFLNLQYKVWKFGPVAEPLFIDLSGEMSILNNFIKNENGIISPEKEFCDDEFSDNDLELMDFVIKHFGDKTAKELVAHTHRPNAPWHIEATNKDVLKMLENQEINYTDFFVDMSLLVAHDEKKKAIYQNYLETF